MFRDETKNNWVRAIYPDIAARQWIGIKKNHYMTPQQDFPHYNRLP